MAQDLARSAASTPRLRAGTRVAAVVSGYHAELCEHMLARATEVLEGFGLEEAPEVVHVPGSFELPLVARRLARRDDVHCVLAIGIIIQGETRHDEFIAQGVVQGIMHAQLDTDTPILFGVLTTRNEEQARARAIGDDPALDKGAELGRAAAGVLAALEAADGGVS